MKRIFCYMLSAAILLTAIFSMTLINSDGNASKVKNSPSDSVKTDYNNVADFSNKQGYQNWYYYINDTGSDTLKYMVFDMDEGRWNGRDFYAFMEINQYHPGNNTETVLAFKSDRTGSATIDAKFKRCPTENAKGDGVFIYIVVNDFNADYLYYESISESDLTQKTFSEQVAFNKDDVIYFVLNNNISNSFDNTNFDITITYN